MDDVRKALLRLCDLEGGPASVTPPRGYPHLGLALIDAVYSLRADYDKHVIPVVNAYCRMASELAEPNARFDASVREHDVDALLSVLGSSTEDELVDIFQNRQCAPGTRVRKAVVVREVGEALRSVEVVHRDDLEVRWTDPSVGSAFRGVAGVGHAAWRYLLALSSIERVKPDVMVTRWVRKVMDDESVTPLEAALLLEQAAAEVDGLTIRAADHLVWRFQSGRLSGKPG